MRSSLLGGGSTDDYDDYDDEDEEIADPKALRSPLLRAVTSAHEQVPPVKPQQQPPPPPQPPAQPYQQGAGYGSQQDPGSPLFRQPLTPPQPNNNYAEPMSQQMHPQDMQQMQQQQMQQQMQQQHVQPQIQSMQQPPQQAYPPAQPSSPPAPPQSLQQASSPFARNPEPTLIDQPIPSRLSTSNMPTTVKPSKPARFQPEEPEITSRPSFDKFASDAPEHGAGGGGSVSPLVAALCVLGILLKGWYFFSYPSMWNQAPFVADQFAEILVMVALIIVIVGVSKGRN